MEIKFLISFIVVTTKKYKYRQYQRLTITKKYRPDLYNKYNLTKEDIKILKERENNIQTKKELEAINKGKKFIKS